MIQSNGVRIHGKQKKWHEQFLPTWSKRTFNAQIPFFYFKLSESNFDTEFRTVVGAVHQADGSADVAHLFDPFKENSEIKVLLLEGVNAAGIGMLQKAGYNIETNPKSLSEEELIKKIPEVHILGIRSKTKITKNVLAAAKNLIAIGCFCIGTNQVDLETCSSLGIPVFNSQGGSMRSVAELVIANVFALARRLGDSNNQLHSQQMWSKSATGCYQIEGKTLGVIGYGRIGQTAGKLAEALGMNVVFYDAYPVRPQGNARAFPTVEDVLKVSDFVTLHVPATKDTDGLIGPAQLAMMKPSACIINTSRGSVLQMPALVEALKNGKLGGVAVDVYVTEPLGNNVKFETPLQGCPNTILTPHIGGSTEEAQRLIGEEVAGRLISYASRAATVGSCNIAAVDGVAHPENERVWRLANVHRNVPGVLKQINNILSDYNIERQTSTSKGAYAYMVADVSLKSHEELRKVFSSLAVIPEMLRTRVLHWQPVPRSGLATPVPNENDPENDD